MANHPNRSRTEALRKNVLAELADRYTALDDDYRRYVRDANASTLREVLDLARSDAPARAIHAALGIDD